MTIPHPTGSEEFEAELYGLNYPPPWRLDEDAPGEVLAANGATVLVAGRPDLSCAKAEMLATWIVLAVNTLTGYRTKIEDA